MDRIHGVCCFTYVMVLVAFFGSTLAQTDDDNPQCSNLAEKWAVALGKRTAEAKPAEQWNELITRAI